MDFEPAKIVTINAVLIVNLFPKNYIDRACGLGNNISLLCSWDLIPSLAFSIGSIWSHKKQFEDHIFYTLLDAVKG